MDSKLSRWCEGLIEACWLVAVLAVPLFFNIHSDRVFEPDKLALLRSIALVMIAAWLMRALDSGAWRNIGRLRFANPDAVWHKPFTVTIMLLIAVYLIATIFSVTPRVSWAGSYQRLQGTYTFLSYIVVFALMASTIKSPAQIRRVVTVAIVTSIPVALYGLIQRFGHDPLPWGGNVQVRVTGHMGNAIFIAAYLIMVVPLTLARVIDAFNRILGDERLDTTDLLRSSVYIFILAIQLLTIYWSGSRGPLIGLGVGLFAFVLILLVSLRDASGSAIHGRLRETLPALAFLLPSLFALLISPYVARSLGALAAIGLFFLVVALSVLGIFILVAARRGWRWLWMAWILLTLFVAGWLLLFNVPATTTAAYRQVPFVGDVLNTLDEWRELPTIGSFGRMLDPSFTTGREKSGRVRVLIWQGVVDLIRPHAPLTYPDGRPDVFNALRPLLGYGPESMYVAYNKFYPPELATVEARNASPDRSHNETFDTLVITGLAGLVAWQILYLGVILYAFRFLGVVRSRRNALVFVILWLAGALTAALLTLTLLEPIYLGVAIPTGVIVGIVVYLIYYALFERGVHSDGDEVRGWDPFDTDRLLMNALVAAVIAHYVEIHFGIAISATRLYFFVYVALIVALGYRRISLIRSEPAPRASEAQPTRGEKRRRKATADDRPVAAETGWSGLVVAALLMTLMLGLLGYSFITYSLPPDKVITSAADLSTREIVRQSLLQNARREFADWPFVYSMFILAWVLGWLVFIGEMAKHGEIQLAGLSSSKGAGAKRTAAVILLLALAAIAFGARFLSTSPTMTATLGKSTAPLIGVVCVLVAGLFLLKRPLARASAGVLFAFLVTMAILVLLGGGVLPAVIMFAAGGLGLWLTWDSRWRSSLIPIAGLVVASWLAGYIYTFIHASRYRSILFYRPTGSPSSAAFVRSLEAQQSTQLLAGVYVFILLVIILLSLALGWSALRSTGLRRTNARTAVIIAGAAVIIPITLFLVVQTNMRVIQADMIYKRAKPFDEQATRATQADPEARREAWDAAIAIYRAAVARAPSEDFYYLFLGRALLERAGLTTNQDEASELLTEAERLLLQAQHINPLNTDHTANLARLNTRWYGVATDDTERQERLALADRYYRDALVLSPQNSVVRNEYARLALEVEGDCPKALALYDQGVTIDPYYDALALARADAYVACSQTLPAEQREEFLTTAATALEERLQAEPDNLGIWVRLAELQRQLGDYTAALAAVDQARRLNEPVRFAPSELDLLEATILADSGDKQGARTVAEAALENAPDATAEKIRALLQRLDSEE